MSDTDVVEPLNPDSEPPVFYALVDVTAMEKIGFVLRAPLVEIQLWSKILGADGRLTKRLDMISDVEQLQYLYWNTTQKPPANELEALKTACAELANNVPIDTTLVDDLKLRLPADVVSQGQTEEENMGQGGTEKSLEKGGGEEAAAGKKKGGKKAAAKKEEKVKKVKDPTGRPSEGTQTRKVWDIADKLAAANDNVTPTRAAVVEASVKAGVNKATAGVQYGAWFKGMQRTPAPKPVKEEKKTEGGETEETEEETE